MAQLTGSEKQVAWATKIRKEFLPEIERYVERCIESNYKPEEISQWFQSLDAETSATFWIDHRSDSPQLLFVKMQKKGR
ncbi:MAG TPA: hypothetical protein VFA10_14290 [Ktedonobacteraceae bacterium]|nr:hypothetical protein [Ktedonobacteraceae bacterium]